MKLLFLKILITFSESLISISIKLIFFSTSSSLLILPRDKSSNTVTEYPFLIKLFVIADPINPEPPVTK